VQGFIIRYSQQKNFNKTLDKGCIIMVEDGGGSGEKYKVTLSITKSNDEWVRELERKLGYRCYSLIINACIKCCRENQVTCDNFPFRL